MSKRFFLRCWQPLPAENHLLHNGVAQVGIEEEINAEAFWPFRCRFEPCKYQSLPTTIQEVDGKATVLSGRSKGSEYATKIFRSQVQAKTGNAQNLISPSSSPASLLPGFRS